MNTFQISTSYCFLYILLSGVDLSPYIFFLLSSRAKKMVRKISELMFLSKGRRCLSHLSQSNENSSPFSCREKMLESKLDGLMI